MNYVFDVDGTLTPSRDLIDSEFGSIFLNFCKTHPVYIVTGSDYKKTEEQLGSDICYAVEGIFNCSGNVLTKRGIRIYQNIFVLTEQEREALEKETMISGFSVRTGNHIELRIGTVNFSIVGRNANKVQRQQYIEWDNATNERKIICQRLNSMFPRLDCVVGGETGIDIFQKDKDKSQIAKYVYPFTFFGDRCEVGGNDHTIYLLADHAHWVANWENTYQILKDICDEERRQTTSV
jgi:phosphomannomutase